MTVKTMPPRVRRPFERLLADPHPHIAPLKGRHFRVSAAHGDRGARRRYASPQIVAIVIGALLILVGLGLLVPGAFLLWAHETQRDETGFMRPHPSRGHRHVCARDPDFTVSMGDVTDWVPKDWAGTVRCVRSPPRRRSLSA
jgi:hypothetical protein